jgi:hypothetical protein
LTNLQARFHLDMSVLDADLVRRRDYFWEEEIERREGQLEGKLARVREAGEACMKGRHNDTRVTVFVIYCNGL